jgi:hypothetical protein
MPIYPKRTRMGFLNLLHGLVLLGVWKPYLLTPPLQSHNHHTRMSERRSQMISQLQLALHPIPPDLILPRISVQNSLLLSILNGLRNLLRFLARGPIMPVPQAFPQRAASLSIRIHNTHTYRHITCHIPRSTNQCTQACYIHTWHLTHILHPRRRCPNPLHVNVLGRRKHKLLGANASG